MERPAANVTAAGAAHHHRRRQPGPVPRGGDVIREHIVRARNEVDELHLFPDALAQRLEECEFSHHRTLNQSLSAAGGSTYTPGSALSDVGNGSLTHASVA